MCYDCKKSSHIVAKKIYTRIFIEHKTFDKHVIPNYNDE